MCTVAVLALLGVASAADSLPELNKITTHTFGTPYGCKGTSMNVACISFSTDHPSADNCDVMLNGGCNTGELYLDVNLGGDSFSIITDLGDKDLETLTSSKVLNYENIAQKGNVFKPTQTVKVGSTYAVILNRASKRAVFEMKVKSASDKGAEVEAAVRLYDILTVSKKSPGFSWSKNNTKA